MGCTACTAYKCMRRFKQPDGQCAIFGGLCKTPFLLIIYWMPIIYP